MSPDSLRLFAQRPSVHDETILTAIITTAADHDLWSHALPLIDAALTTDTPDTVWQTLIHQRDRIPADLLTELAAHARALGQNQYGDQLQPLGTATH
ncbi:hypothetical protein KHQ06_24720 [Nocardia tengchongensis]|uniref:Uncharacterized protein n=1 Tax=Nocardia tengchongensis TaxID=2055889 RepID=A0ABX8CHW9_9NOCA|nr:hypothetical protein [Nocardia tengchongensis]QVI19564.1 hypothetical protein KHQ06_24720 [Nocardia tengchongensis]